MSNTPVQEPPGQDLSSGSSQTLPSRPIQPVSDPSASKRVCFYKSGDHTFSGHRMVINARTFKTFDALLDALSKKVPLPFGVRTITTPRGTHLVRALEDLHDGGSYVCSDQKRVKPLNLDEVNRRQVPWNTTRPYSAGRRLRLQLGKRQVAANRPAKVTERVAVRTPKKLEVINNRDPTIKRTIVLQRRTAPTFDALLDYLSQILQFPVLKLFSTDGRRVDGLATLILCSGVVVAAGNEPFRLGNYNFHRTGPMTQSVYMETMEPSMLQAKTRNNKSLSSGRGSRNFSLSSERYIVDQINKSRNGSMNSQPNRHRPPFGTEAKHRHPSVETCGTEMVVSEHRALIVPHEDDIEKSFRVNEDGSMTVEMKVHLTIKEEEVLHWTTTVSRSSLSTRTTAQASISESGNSSPDSNNQFAKDSPSLSQDEMKEENHPASAGKAVGFNDVQAYDGYSSTAVGKQKIGFKRTPTPGPRHVNKKASLESVKTVTETGVHESTVGHYSYVERTADGETTEGYCVVRHSSSSSNRPIPKPRKTASAGANKTGSRSSERSSGLAEVLQIESNGMEVTETVMHIYENQGCYDNYYANEEYSVDSAPLQGSVPAAGSKPSTVSDLRSTNSDCDVDFSTTDSLQRQKEEMLSLSSEPLNPLHEVTNSLPSVAENKAGAASNSQTQRAVKTKFPKSERKKRTATPRNQKGSSSTGSSGQKQKETKAPSDKSKHSSTDKLGSSKKSLGSPESAKSGQKSIDAERPQTKKVGKGEKMTKKEESSLAKTKPVAIRKMPSQRQNLNKAAAKDHGHSLNTSNTRPQMKKNMQGTLQTKKPLMPSKRTISKPKSVIENQTLQPKEDSGLPESFSMPSLNPSPSEVHQYVENWLEKVSPDMAPCTEDAATDESEWRAKVVFQIGDDSGSDEKNGAKLDERFPSVGDAVKKSTSSLSVPPCHAGAATATLHGDQFLRGLCVSMPSVRVDPAHQENRLRSHRSAEAIGPAEDASTSSNSNVLDPKVRMKPVMQHLCSSVQCIQRASDTNTATNLEKAKSLPDFSVQVASVFGSSCRAFLSFLSVMTLRDNLSGVETKSTSEAQIMMESLQKISTIEDEEEQRSSLTDLQSRASSQFRERWKDFQILRERLQSEPLSPRVSETEFALDVVSEGGDVFEDRHSVIDELMEELNMPHDLREEISSTIQHAKCFYPVDESTFVETERNQSESEEDVEKFVDECENEPDAARPNEDATETEKINEDSERDKDRETGTDVTEMSQTERDEPLQEREDEEEEQTVDLDREAVSKDEDGETNILNDKDGEETEEGEWEEKGEERAVTEADWRQEKWKAETESEEEKTEGGKESDIGDREVVEEAEEGSVDGEDDKCKEDGSTEETDEREGAGETEVEERGEGEEDEEENEEGGGTEGGKWEGVTKEAGEATEDRDEGEEEEVDENIAESLTEIAEEEAEEMTEVTEEKDEGEITENVTEEVEEDGAGSVSEEQDEEEVNEEDSDEAVEEKVEEEEETEVACEESNQEEDEREEEREQEEVESVDSEDEEPESDKKVEEEDGCSEGKGSRTEEEEMDGEITISVKEERREEEECGGSEESNQEEDEREEREREQEEVESVDSEDEEPECDKKVEEEDGRSEEKGSRTEEEETDGEITISVKEERRDEEECGGSEESNQEEDEGEKREREQEEAESVESEDGEPECDKKVEEEDGRSEGKGSRTEEEETDGEITISVKEERRDEEECGGSEESNQEENEREKREREQEEAESVESVEIKEGEEESANESEEDEEPECDEKVEEEDGCSEGKGSRTEEEETDGEITVSVKEERREEEECEGSAESKSVVSSEGLDQDRGQGSTEEAEDSRSASDDADDAEDKHPADKSLDSDTQSSLEMQADVNINLLENNAESPTKNSSEGQCEDDKGNGTDCITEAETDEGGEHCDGKSGGFPHPVEISQELLDFVNSALQSSSLVFTYDSHGKVRLEPDKVRVMQTKQPVVPERRKNSSYGLKRLPSPITSDLSDYRPETSESDGYKSQDTVDVLTDSGEDSQDKPFPVCRSKTRIPNGGINAERANSQVFVASYSENLQNSRLKSGGSFSSFDSGNKASREDLSYFSGGSSQRTDVGPGTGTGQRTSSASKKDSPDGVLIDRGRWLLKENHLIRRSPPLPLGMYGNADSTSLDTSQENTGEDSPPHYKTQHNPLAAISSSELEEMAKPLTPKCTYYNMPHGSDSDPFLDDGSLKSGGKDASSSKWRGFRVSPTVDTTKTWASKNGSLSSFTSVEFKIPDRKVHPEGESSAVPQARRTSSGGGQALQAPDSWDTLQMRCSQYCPIL